jgi:hypothetical protein
MIRLPEFRRNSLMFMDRVVYLLKVADPIREAASKRDLKPREAKPPTSNDNLRLDLKKQNKIGKATAEEKPKDSSIGKDHMWGCLDFRHSTLQLAPNLLKF